MPHFGMPELLIVLAIVLLLFGAKKVPEFARGLGQGMKEFKQSLSEVTSGEEPSGPAASRAPEAAAPAPSASTAPAPPSERG